MDHAMMQALKRHLASAETLDVSRFQFIDMEKVRQAAGTLWPEVRERVFLASRSIIERRIAEDDLILQCATGFLVIYKAIGGEAAADTTRRIREDMEQFFLGERFAELMRVEAVSENLTPAEFQAALAAAGVETPEAFTAPAQAPAPPPRAVLDGLEFENAWDVPRQAVASYFVRPRVLERPDGPELCAHGLAAALEKPEDRLAFDLEVLERSADALQALLARGVRCALIAPAGYAALAGSRRRAGYVSALARLPDPVRTLIWVRVTGAPADTPAATVQETGRTLLSYTAQLFFDADLGAVTLERAVQSDAPWLGARLPAKLTGAARQDVDRFMAQAGRAGRSVYLTGVDGWEMLRFASRTQAKLLAGGAVGRHAAPMAPFRLTRDGLLARAAA